jgi:hypothetical protein
VKLLLTTLVFAPLFAAVIAGLFGRRIGDKASMILTTGLLFLCAGLAWYTFIQVGWGAWGGHYVFELLPFIDVGDFQSAWSIRLDTLSAVMLIVVTTVSALVHLYSWGYMADDPDKPRFFAYLSLFTFAMLMLVTANDFMQLFFGWEGVGLASYLLIGFWFKKPTANAASIKAFVTNRVGVLDVPHHPLPRPLPPDRRQGWDELDLRGPELVGARSGRRTSVHRRHGQVGPVLPARLAARRHGGPDTGVRPDPRGDHGDGGRLYGLPVVAAL